MYFVYEIKNNIIGLDNEKQVFERRLGARERYNATVQFETKNHTKQLCPEIDIIYIQVCILSSKQQYRRCNTYAVRTIIERVGWTEVK